MKLIVIAHPDKNSFTHEITKTISLRYAKNGTVYKVIDLYRTDLKQDYLYFKDILNIDHLSSREKIQGLIRESDEIILIFPIWWGGMPAIMKNFFDTNFLYDYAFKYNEKRDIIPLLKGKTISIISTSNSPSQRYEDNMLGYFYTHFNECCGMKIGYFKVIGNMMDKTIEQKQELLEKISSNKHFKINYEN